MKELARGAEATIYRTDEVLKVRPKKEYRHPVLDEKLRKSRTRKEAKILSTLEELGIPAPKLLKANEKDMSIAMSFINGPKLRDVLEDHLPLLKQLGKYISRMHDSNIVHGDLTTSNVLVQETLVLIDFGLSVTSHKVEDKAVDLHLFKQALSSKHNHIAEKAWSIFLEGYTPKERKEILQRLEDVEARGRNKK